MLRTFVLYRTGTSVKGAACDAGEQSEWHRKPPHLPYSYVRRFLHLYNQLFEHSAMWPSPFCLGGRW
jgi:hypothetical protein